MQKNLESNQCDHIIGILHHRDYSELTTAGNLLDHIRSRIEWNDALRRDPCFIDLQHLIPPVYTMEHYGDLRRSSNLARFKHCPECGQKIDWRTIKQMKI